MSYRNNDLDYRMRASLQDYELTNNPETHKKKSSFFKRVLSWLAFWGISVVITTAGSLIIALSIYLVEKLHAFSRAFFIFILFVAGSLMFYILSLPFTLGIPVSVICSESIYPSKNGGRYKFFGIFYIISSVIGIIMSVLGLNVKIFPSIYMLIHSIWLLVVFNSCRKTENL